VLLGVIASRDSSSLLAPFGKQTVFFSELAQAAQRLGADIAFFSPDDLASGSCLRWRQAWVPEAMHELPQAVYDRLLPRNQKEVLDLRYAHTRLESAGARVANSLALTELLGNKLAFTRLLASHGLPTLESMLLSMTTCDDIEAHLGSGAVYIKPLMGSQGEGILVLQRALSALVLYSGTGSLVARFDGISSAHEWLLTNLPRTQTIVMPCAGKSQLDGQPFDIRVLIQSNGARYEATGMAARLGQRGSWVSNLSAGGSAVPMEEMVQRISGLSDAARQGRLTTAVADLAVRCARILDKTLGPYAEIGIDVLLDSQGQPLIIEGNAKPARWVFVELARTAASQSLRDHYRSIRAKAVSAPLEFLLSRAGGSADLRKRPG
jgi:glutathione synthase/RimK-type ligase-like ATP-grasp enzyme